SRNDLVRSGPGQAGGRRRDEVPPLLLGGGSLVDARPVVAGDQVTNQEPAPRTQYTGRTIPPPVPFRGTPDPYLPCPGILTLEKRACALPAGEGWGGGNFCLCTGYGVLLLAIDFAEHDVDRAQDRDQVGDEVVLADLGHDGEVDEARSPHLAARGDLRAVADDVEAKLAAGILDGRVGLAHRGLDLAQVRRVLPRRQAVHRLLDDLAGLDHLLDPQPVPVPAVAHHAD